MLNFEGTILFVSHDRYFVQKIANTLLVFDNNSTQFFPYGYSQYLEYKNKTAQNLNLPQDTVKKEKKQYTTPGKEKAKLERQIKKTEEQIKLSEEKLSNLYNQINAPENFSDYNKLEELRLEIEKEENAQLELLELLEELTKKEPIV